MAVLTKKSKIFIKAKLTASKSCLLGLVYSMICCILRDAILLSLDLLKFQSLEFQIFYHFWLVLWYQSKFHAIYPGTIFCCTVPSKFTQCVPYKTILSVLGSKWVVHQEEGRGQRFSNICYDHTLTFKKSKVRNWID